MRLLTCGMLLAALATTVIACGSGDDSGSSGSQLVVKGLLQKLSPAAARVSVTDIAELRATAGLEPLEEATFPRPDEPAAEVVSAIRQSASAVATAQQTLLSVFVVQGRFEARKADLEAQLRERAVNIEDYQGVPIIRTESSVYRFQAFLDSNTWLAGQTNLGIKEMIDLARGGRKTAYDIPELRAALQKVGAPGYVFVAGTGRSFSELKLIGDALVLGGLRYGVLNIRRETATTSEVWLYFQFARTASAVRTAAALQDKKRQPPVLQATNVGRVQVSRQGLIVVARAAMPHTDVVERLKAAGAS